MLDWIENAYGEAYLPVYNDAFSRLPADAVFKQYIHGLMSDEHYLYIVVGTDSGLLPQYVQTHFAESGSKFIFIELPEVIAALKSHNPDLGEDFGVFSLSDDIKTSIDLPVVQVVGSSFDLDLLANVNGYADFIVRTKFKLVKSLAVVEKETAQYRALYEQVKQQFFDLEIHSHVGAARHYMDAWFEDVSELLVPLTRLKNVYKGKTFVLLGGAPSLPLIFEWLKANREHLVVMAAVRIAGRLHREGIVPDYFVGVDAKPQMLDYCRELFQFHDKSTLITSHHLAPNVLSQWAGPIVYMHQRLPFGKLFADEQGNAAAVGPTVMNAALHIAGYMGAAHIYLSGVDMCYSPQGQSHESSSIESQIGRYMRFGGQLVNTYAEVQVETDVHMLSAGQAMSEQAVWMKRLNPKLNLVNVNPYATKINQMVHVPVEQLAEVDDKVSDEQRQSARQLASLTLTEVAQVQNNLLLPAILSFKQKLTKAQKHAKAGLMLIQSIDLENQHLISQSLTQVIKTRKRIESAMGDDLFALFDYGFIDYVAILQPLNDTNPSVEQLLATMTQYYKAIAQSSAGLLQVLSRMVDRARWRAKECNCLLTPALVQYWLDQGQPGRCWVWFERCGKPALSGAQQRLFEQAQTAFTDLLAHKVPSFRKGMMSKDKQLISLWKFSSNAIAAKDVERVADLADYIASLEGDEFKQLATYLKAHEYSLTEQWQASEAEIGQVTHDRLIFPALQLRLTNALRQDDLMATLQAVEDLAGFDDYYFYILAVLAQMAGLTELTGNAFIYYLQRRPTDLAALWDYWHYLQTIAQLESVEQFQQFLCLNAIEEPRLHDEVSVYLLALGQ